MLRKLFLVLLLAGIAACSRQSRTVTRGVYYWKTTYQPKAYELDRLDSISCERIYLRFCDVDWNDAVQQAVPVAPVHFSQAIDTKYNYIPVVFITQRTLQHLSKEHINLLADNLDKYIGDVCLQQQIHPAEIQIDCDWTAGTKDVYFELLEQLKQRSFFKGKTLSCTIRMHQVKYLTRNGIPPADKGLLMCYNMGNMKKPGDHNSILDIKETKSYTRNIAAYPIPLDIALPLFDWVLLFRKQQFVGILRDVHAIDIDNNKLFDKTAENLYNALSDTFYKGYSIRKGDIIRVEAPSYDDIATVAAYTASRLKNKNPAIVLYHCDSLTLNKATILAH